MVILSYVHFMGTQGVAHAMDRHALEEASPAFRARDLGGPALRTFFNIAKRWSLTEQEQLKILGLGSRSTLQSWKAKAKTDHAPVSIGRDVLERISYVLGIYKAINTLLPDERLADTWLRAPNAAPLFGGRSALDRMTAGNVGDLYVVRQYLDAELD